MRNILHITNGDSAQAIMKQAGIEGEILPWRDVLHDGPVPEGLDLAGLSHVRADYISRVGWGKYDEVYASFCERDKTIMNADRFDQLSLWFEHDLYDQLQVLQILDVLVGQNLKNTLITLACSNDYLGEMNPAEMRDFQSSQQLVTSDQYVLASRAWTAFRQTSPVTWAQLQEEDLSPLPFLQDTIKRTLQELPDSRSGVSRTAMQVLAIVHGGERRPGWVFGENQKRENRIFMGDSSFWLVINRLLTGPNALLTLNHGQLGFPPDPAQRLALTSLGQQVLAGERNWLNFNKPDYYIGGVHCCAEALWCFDSEVNRVVRFFSDT